MISAWLSLILFITSVILYTWKAGRHKLWFSVILVLSGIYIILNALLLASNYFTGDGINDSVIYTITSTISGAGVQKYILPAVGLIVAVLLLFSFLSWFLRLRKNHQHSKLYSILAVLLALVSIETTPAYQQVSYLVRSQMAKGDDDFYSYYKVPAKSISGTRPNLVYIYAESLERTYFDNHAFPNLAPELNNIKDHAIDFSNTEQLPGTEYTIAGLVASQCGIPLFAPFDGNASSSLSAFYPQNVCLGDILKAAGYQNYFYQGASLKFAGKDLFFSSHGFDHVYGFDELKSQVPDPDYRNDWGWYDDTLLDIVFDKYLALAKQEQPFALFALTVDTHHPDGFISRSCQKNTYAFAGKENKSFAAVSCGQEHIAQLINKIRATPYFKNTIIVVGSDHLAMNNTAFKYLNQHQRRDLFFMLRGDKPEAKIVATKRSTLDNGATVLDALGGDNFIGLGRSSLSSTPLAVTHLNLKEKINRWKPNIIKMWNFPTSITNYQIDTASNTFSFSGSTFKLPLLLAVGKDHIEPKLDTWLATPLKQQLAQFVPDEKFVWADRCYKIGSIWDASLSLNHGLCVASGTLNIQPTIVQIQPGTSQGKITFENGKRSDEQYAQSVARLRIKDADLKYHSDRILFNLPGLPEQVQNVAGLSYLEPWGRWSDANLQPEVTIQYQEALPATFTLTLTARAFGSNSQRPVTIKIGDWQQQVRFGEQDSTVTLQVSNPSRARTIVLIPPTPESSTLGAMDGFAARQLGIGLVSLQVSP